MAAIWNGPTHPFRVSARPRDTGSVVPVRATYLGFRTGVGSAVAPQLTIIVTLVDPDIDANSSNIQHKPATLPFAKRSTDNTGNENGRAESSSNGKLTVSSGSPHPQFRTAAGQVDLISVVGSGAKILLNIAKESADVFGPLKSVLSGISAICDQYEVCSRTPVSRVICS